MALSISELKDNDTSLNLRWKTASIDSAQTNSFIVRVTAKLLILVKRDTKLMQYNFVFCNGYHRHHYDAEISNKCAGLFPKY